MSVIETAGGRVLKLELESKLLFAGFDPFRHKTISFS